MHRTPHRLATLLTATCAVALLGWLPAGCGSEDDTTSRRDESARSVTETEPAPAPDRRPKPARCPPNQANCRSASGRVLYVESTDPDGDGDAHLVLLSEDGVTSPGISVVDVARDLRPNPLPRAGDRVSAAGPVYPGSYGQRQIQAIELNVAPGRRAGR
jgi:hypothetical protein